MVHVGTGTGQTSPSFPPSSNHQLKLDSIWLEDVSQLLGSLPENSVFRQYGGFDITLTLLPHKPKDNNISYTQHDTLKPFPQEYHNKYDLVHVCFMAVAFNGPDWEVAVRNLLELLSTCLLTLKDPISDH